MTNRSVPFIEGEYYHLYSRGVDKRSIFLNLADYKRFIRLMYLCNGQKPVDYRNCHIRSLSEIDVGNKLVSIGSYCLMPNHFHLLVKETSDGGISKFMRKLLIAYSYYFNKKYERTGALFGSRFKSAHLNTDTYLKYIFSYIHLNPLKIIFPNWKHSNLDEDACRVFLNKYVFSSYIDYGVASREESLILNMTEFPEYFSNIDEWQKSLTDWFKEDPTEIVSR